jgi:GTP diphosphokinase / guanosine-3',5'-bis(diphosphate) 3'-diphosphatase
MSDEIVSFARALDFAARKHTAQRRKGEAHEPYINHLAEVALLLAEATEGEDLNLVLAGLLHDTIEDTETTYEELAGEFEEDVAGLVREVTDDKSLLKAKRKELQVQTASQKSDRAKMIKIADKISNLLSILQSPPAGWSEERKREYFEWADRVVNGCRGVNRPLEDKFDEAYSRYPSISSEYQSGCKS